MLGTAGAPETLRRHPGLTRTRQNANVVPFKGFIRGMSASRGGECHEEDCSDDHTRKIAFRSQYRVSGPRRCCAGYPPSNVVGADGRGHSANWQFISENNGKKFYVDLNSFKGDTIQNNSTR